MTRILTTTLVLCAAAALGACALGSKEPLITEPDIVPGLLDGEYQRYRLTDPREVPRDVRRDCVTPGIAFRNPDEGARPRVLRPPYCPYDGKQRLPTVQIRRDGSDYRITAPEGQLSLRFQRLRDGIYLMQVDDAQGEGLRYGYVLSREAPGGIDLAVPDCRDFPSLEPDTVVSNFVEASDAAPEPETEAEPEPDVPESATEAPKPVLPGQNTGCEAPSLAAIQAELDVVVDRLASGREPVWFLLRRVRPIARP